MRRRPAHLLLLALASACGESSTAPPPPVVVPEVDERVLRPPLRPFGDPIAVVDLMDPAGAASLAAQWRFVDASIIEIDSNDPGPDLRPTGPAARSHDVSPRPRADGWEEAAWSPIDPPALSARRGHGHFALGWFRTRITLPARVGETEISGTTVVFEIVADDYSEVWVDGHLSASPGDSGGGPVSGFNTPNRVVLTRSAEPGHAYDVAVLVMNAPLSVSPPNFLWVRSAVLDVYASAPRASVGRIDRRDPRFAAIFPDGAAAERIATGFDELAGMVWTGGALLFSDPGASTIYRYDPQEERVGIWRSHCTARGLAVDSNERVLIAEHGQHRVVRIERTAATTTLADRFEGHDLAGLRGVAVDASGAVWLTESGDTHGVFRIAAEGALSLASEQLAMPLGVWVSPDGATLWVVDGSSEHRGVTRHSVREDGSLDAPSEVLHTDAPIAALAFDAPGNLYVAGASGVTVATQSGELLGVIDLGEPATGLAWSDAALFVASRTSLYRVGAR